MIAALLLTTLGSNSVLLLIDAFLEEQATQINVRKFFSVLLRIIVSTVLVLTKELHIRE